MYHGLSSEEAEVSRDSYSLPFLWWPDPDAQASVKPGQEADAWDVQGRQWVPASKREKQCLNL